AYDWKILAIGGKQSNAEIATKQLCDLGYKNVKVMALSNSQDDEQQLINTLKQSQWDAVSIGGMINGYITVQPEQKDEIFYWFNRLVNLVHEHAPHSQFIFVKSPQDIHDGIQRVFAAARIKKPEVWERV
ncbi:unnamed protein product, partial [Didymodactylos carnosus]